MNLVNSKTIKTINPEHNLYIIRVSNIAHNLTYIKLGYSSKIQDRISSYYNSNPLTELVGTYYREDAVLFEKYIHRTYTSIVMTEWYLESLLETFLSEIQNKEFIVNAQNIEVDEVPFKKLVKHFKNTHINGVCDWSFYTGDDSKPKLIEECYKLYKEVYTSEWYCKNMVETYNNLEDQLRTLFHNKFEINKKYSIKEIRTIIETTYKEENINRVIKATELEKHFEVIPITINRGRGYFIKDIIQ